MIELSKEEYVHVLPLLKNIAYEPVFAYSVIDQNQSGKVFVDHSLNPAYSLIINSYGQYLLAGSGDNERFMNDVVEYLLNDQNHLSFYDLYASTPNLLFQISEKLLGKTVLLHRSSFTFDLHKFQHLKTILNPLPERFVLKRMDCKLFEKYRNEMDSSYNSLWSSARHFIERGFGYCIVMNDQFASVCNSFFVGGGYADIDIVTVDEYQNQGLASGTSDWRKTMNELQQVYKNLYSEKGNRLYPLEKYKFCPQCGNKFLQCDPSEITKIQCSNCQHIIYSNPLPAVVVLIEYDDKILLGKRNGYFGKGKWCIPGGAIEYHEDFISAAYREIKEETGLDNNNIEIVSILNVVSNFIAPQRHVLSIVLLAKFISGNPTPADDLDELHWYCLNEPLPEMFLPAEVNLIEHYASSKFKGILISS